MMTTETARMAYVGLEARQPRRDERVETGGRAKQGGQDEPGREQAEPVGERPRDQEERRREPLHGRPEPIPQQLVHRDDLAAEVRRDEERAHREAADHVAHDELQEGEVGRVGVAGDADEGDGAGLGRDDRAHDRPPRQRAAAHEVIPQVAVRLREPRAEQDDADQVDREDGEVDRVHRATGYPRGQEPARPGRRPGPLPRGSRGGPARGR
jgi:hypothetical protein